MRASVHVFLCDFFLGFLVYSFCHQFTVTHIFFWSFCLQPACILGNTSNSYLLTTQKKPQEEQGSLPFSPGGRSPDGPGKRNPPI